MPKYCWAVYAEWCGTFHVYRWPNPFSALEDQQMLEYEHGATARIVMEEVNVVYKGMRVDIYRTKAYRSPQNVLDAYDSALLIGPGIPEISEAKEGEPVVRLERNFFNTVRIVPVGYETKRKMFGGTFIYTSDSRFHDAVSKLILASSFGAVPLHDRIED